MWKKLLCILLSALLCIGVLISCAEDPVDPDDTPALPSQDGESDGDGEGDGEGDGAGENSPYADDLPDRDLGDIDITFAYYDTQSVKSGCSVIAEENNGDLINDSMYNRNTQVEERFNVNLVGNCVSTAGGISTTVTPVLTSGADDYDVLVGYQYYDIGLAATGLLYNINQLQNGYIDINNPWWSTDYINNINYADKLYWLTGDITLAHIGYIIAGYVNANIYSEFVESEFGNFYDIIRNKEWTFETMMEMAELCYIDLNGNDKEDDGDQYGYLSSLGIEMAYCAGIDSAVREDDGTFSIAIDNDTTSDIMWYLNENHESEYSTHNNTEEGQYDIFTSGEAMVYFRYLATAENAMFRNMEDNFYIVPLPMGDSYSCENYRSTCMTNNNIVGIAHCSTYPEESALVMEALAAESHVSVTPVYYDTVLKDRYTRDEASKEMMDLIRSVVGVDFVNAWSYGYTNAYDFYLTFDADTVASRIATHAPKWQVILDELVETLQALN